MTKLFNYTLIYGTYGDHDTPYMTRIRLGRLRLHIFHRGDADPDCHDHPWSFWTFPLRRGGYIEEYIYTVPAGEVFWWKHKKHTAGEKIIRTQLVPGWTWSYREATHTHRVLYPARLRGGGHTMSMIEPARNKWANWPIVTLVWVGKSKRDWGFLRNRDGKWCWTPWKEYVFGGGKHAPCGD